MTKNEAITLVKAQAISLTLQRGHNDPMLNLFGEALSIVVQEAETNIMMEMIKNTNVEEPLDENKN